MAVSQTTNVGNDPVYWLGRDVSETRRLMLQSQFLKPVTDWTLREAGLTKGMTVLDVGSGPGDVALIAANIVGPEGQVVGVDSNPEILEVARSRAADAGHVNIEFVTGDFRSVDLGRQFDAVIGRLVLTYVADPTTALRTLLKRVKPGGIVAFQEYTPNSVQTFPRLPLWELTNTWVTAAAMHAGLDLEIGYKLHRHFVDAGMPPPRMRTHAVMGGGRDWAGYEYLVACIRSMLPFVYSTGTATEDEVDIDTLADRMRSEVVAARALVKSMDLISAWSTKPGSSE